MKRYSCDIVGHKSEIKATWFSLVLGDVREKLDKEISPYLIHITH